MRNVLVLVLSLGALAPAQSPPPGGGPPPATAPAPLWAVLKPEVAMRGLTLELADVADVDGLDAAAVAKARQLVLGAAPAPGRTQLLRRDSVQALLSGAGEPGSRITLRGADAVRVTASSVELAGDEVLTLARRFVAENLGALAREARIASTTVPGALVVNAGRWSTTFDVVHRSDAGRLGLLRVAVRALVDGLPAAQVIVDFDVRRHAQVLVAAENLVAGQPVKPQQVRLEMREISAGNAGALSDLTALAGLNLRHRLMEGQVLTSRDFAQAPVVHRNGVVQIEIAAGNLNVTAEGVALKDGAVGEQIPVRVSNAAKRLVHAVVVDSRRVRMVLETLKEQSP